MVSLETVKHWKKVVNSYPYPKDDFERAKFQFECLYMVRHSLKQESRWFVFKWNIISIVAFPFLLVVFLLKNLKHIAVERRSAVFTCPDQRYSFVYNDLPSIILEQYGVPQLVNEKGLFKRGVLSNLIDKEAIKIVLKSTTKYPFHFFMNLGLLVNLSRYCSIVKKYQPEAIIVVQVEKYYTTSLLTKYCESKGIKHICVQHGDYFYEPRSSFFRVSEYYAWNKETIKQFEMERAELGVFSLYTPKRLMPSLKKNDHPQYYITYYLQDNNLDSLKRISNVLSRFVKAGLPCSVRKHPRFTLPNEFEQLFKDVGVIIEPIDKVSLNDSLCNTEFIVAHFSTVLTEAIINGFNAVIDDYTESIVLLQELCYTNISKTSLRLSSLIEETFA